MEVLNNMEMLSMVCKELKKFGMFIAFEARQQEFRDTAKAAPYLTFQSHGQIFLNGQGWLLFDSEKEMLNCYNRTVGNTDELTSNPYRKLNPYKGKGRVYAYTCTPTGEKHPNCR